RGAPTAFARDDLVGRAGLRIVDRTHDDGLDHALRADGFGELGQLRLVHAGARLVAARLQLADGKIAEGFARLRFQRHGFGGGLRAEQRFETAAEAALLRDGHACTSFLSCGAVPAFAACSRSRCRRITSPARPRYATLPREALS